MFYTIASLNIVHSDIYLDFSKSGNMYVVSIYESDTSVNTQRTFGSMQAAYAVYEYLSRVFIFGEYTLEDKKNYLLTGNI